MKIRNNQLSSRGVCATICIPTYNGDEYLRQLLEAVFNQKFSFKYEVLVIDSGSKDNTLAILSDFPDVILKTIPNREFGHGKTRNLAAELANGEFVVYLSQDAVPAHQFWLEGMIEPFMINEQIVCVFGKQTPRPLCDIVTKRTVNSVFKSLGPEHSIMINRRLSLVNQRVVEPYLTFFSDVNSAVRRTYLLHHPYRDVRYSEDQLLGSDVLSAGLIKAYTPSGEVFHSNEYSLGDYFYRQFDEAMGMFKAMNVIPSASIKGYVRQFFTETLKDILHTVNDNDYSFKRKVLNITTSWHREFSRCRASYLVSNPKTRNKFSKEYSLECRASRKDG